MISISLVYGLLISQVFSRYPLGGFKAWLESPNRSQGSLEPTYQIPCIGIPQDYINTASGGSNHPIQNRFETQKLGFTPYKSRTRREGVLGERVKQEEVGTWGVGRARGHGLAESPCFQGSCPHLRRGASSRRFDDFCFTKLMSFDE